MPAQLEETLTDSHDLAVRELREAATAGEVLRQLQEAERAVRDAERQRHQTRREVELMQLELENLERSRRSADLI